MKKDSDSFRPLVIFFIIVVVLWITSWFLLKDLDNRGTFGDMFGAVNALFSGLAFAGVIYTILLQKKELGLQRQELSDTRQEFITQNETLKKQRFENTFFQLVRLHHEIVDHLSYHIRDLHLQKRDVVRRACIDLKGALAFSRSDESVLNMDQDAEKTKIEINSLEDEEKYLNIAYEAYLEEYENAFSHYFRNLYHIFNFIYFSNQIDKKEKRYYAAIVRAQLSPDELFLLFYNSLDNKRGYPKFLFMIKEFDVFQNFKFFDVPYNNKEVFEEKIKNLKNPFK